MRDVSFLKKLEQEVSEEYNQVTRKLLDFFDGKYDASTILLELNAFTDDLYARYEQLIKEYTNTLLSLDSGQEDTLNEALSEAEKYIRDISQKSGDMHE